MTGSSGWAYYAATQYILGIRPDFDRMVIDPCIPADWDEYSVIRKWRGGIYNIHISNPDHVEKGVRSVSMDGVLTGSLPVIPEGTSCSVEVIMGKKEADK